MTPPEWMEPECQSLSNTTINMIVVTAKIIHDETVRKSMVEDMITEIRRINHSCEKYKECKDYIENEIRERTNIFK